MYSVRSPIILARASARRIRIIDAKRWTMVRKAADPSSAQGRAALEDLCRFYWPILYGFARRRGLAPCDAEDLTQGFFAELLARKVIARADAARGRFRNFLLASFLNYASHEWARAHSRKRGGGCEMLSLEMLNAASSRIREELVSMELPGKHLDRQWAGNLLERAGAAVRRDYIAANKGSLFAVLKGVLWNGRTETDFTEMGARLGMTAGALKVALHRLRYRIGEKLLSEMEKGVRAPGASEGDVQQLLAALEA